MAARQMTYRELLASLPPAQAAAIERDAEEVAAAAPPFSVATRANLTRLLQGDAEFIRAERERRAREAA